MRSVVSALASVMLTVISVPIMSALVGIWGLERSNFKGDRIPAGYGFLLVLVGVPIYAGIMIGFMMDRVACVFLAGVLGFGVLGLLDDIYGSREVGGFHGHLGLLRQGKVSTGLIKAAFGGLLALVLGAVLADLRPAESLVNGLVIGLAANTLNLLDLRPGRAVSCFWVGVLALAVGYSGRAELLTRLIPIIVPAIWLTVLDRRAKIMLGDAGSNVLGAVLGLALVLAVGLPFRIALIVLMAALHLYSEKYSLSKLIDGNRILRRVDRLLGVR
jgi:UDP-N-acetylmuramyl pentapeptide phosphotransferase/UDP-N-acetylglucosamine-1-phosphate transferase